jgi:hypothetical protein
MKNIFLLIKVFYFLAITLFNQNILYSQLNEPDEKIPILIKNDLLNTRYKLDYSEGALVEFIELKNGYYNYPSEVIEGLDSSSYYVEYRKHISCELNGDSLIDAIIILGERFGGSGYWQYIIPVINNNGIPHPVKPFRLEDRTHIKVIYKKSAIVYLDLLVHDIKDGACCPSKEETWKLRFEKNEFVKLN